MFWQEGNQLYSTHSDEFVTSEKVFDGMKKSTICYFSVLCNKNNI